MHRRRTPLAADPCRILSLLIGGFLFLTLSAPGQADLPAIGFSSLNTVEQDPGACVGYSFNVLSPVEITGLGAYDFAGLSSTGHAVGIWDPSGNLLVSTVVFPSDTLISGFRYRDLLTPITLLPDVDYRIAAVMADKYWAYHASPNPPPGWSVHPSIAWADTPAVASIADGTLRYPDWTHAERWGYFGPNFLLRDANPVPEPALLQLPVLLGLGGLALWRRRRM